MHKLTAGSGYDYLTRQVAALDSTEKGHTGLAAYYAERGEKPGVWIGSGMAGIDGLNAGDPVTAEQMRALFGAGMHPLAEQRFQQLAGPHLTEADSLAVTRLGAPFTESLTVMSARSGSKSRNASPPSTRRPVCPETGRCRPTTGPGSAPKSRASSFPPSMAANRSMRGSWLGRSPKTHGHAPRRSPVTTSPSPPSSACRPCGPSPPPASRP